MSAATVGSLIIWLIVAVIVIAIVVYFVNWLYRRSSKEVSFVRTGLFGEKVVINSGAFVFPFIHEVTPVNMNVLRMQVVRNRADALITKDRMRVDIESEFYVRVPPTREAVAVAAATLGRRTMNVAELETAARYRLPLTLVVMNDGALTAEVVRLRAAGYSERLATYPPVDFAAVARAFGWSGATPRDHAEAAEARAGMGAAGMPYLVDARILPGPV